MWLITKKILARLRKLLGDRRWFWFYLQRCFLDPERRKRISNFLALYFRKSADFRHRHADVAPHVQALALEGITPLGQLLSAEACKELVCYFSGCLIYDPYRPGSPTFYPKQSAGRSPDAHIAHHGAEDVLKAPHLLELANNEHLLQIASGFLGCKPTIGFLAAWWSYPTEKGAQQAEHFHRDVDDWRFLKLFVYLDEVGLENGPHVYVRRSATSKKLTSRIRRLNDQEVIESFGHESLLYIPGAAGTGFFENTFGIHKGLPVISGSRLIFQVVYSMFPLPYAPLRPVSYRDVRLEKFDPWINRVYLKES